MTKSKKKKCLIAAGIAVVLGLLLWYELSTDDTRKLEGAWECNVKYVASSDNGNMNIYGKDTMYLAKGKKYYEEGVIEINFSLDGNADKSVHGRIWLLQRGTYMMENEKLYQDNAFSKAILLKKWTDNGDPLTKDQEQMLATLVAYFDNVEEEDNPERGMQIQMRGKDTIVGLDEESEETEYNRIDLDYEKMKTRIDQIEKKDLAQKKKN